MAGSKTLQHCKPQRCEIHETAGHWASYLQANYSVPRQTANGHNLALTPETFVLRKRPV